MTQPSREPERRREYNRAYYRANAARLNAKSRKQRAQARQWRREEWMRILAAPVEGQQ